MDSKALLYRPRRARFLFLTEDRELLRGNKEVRVLA